MKRILRIAGAIGASCLVAVAAGAVALRYLLPPEKARAFLERQLESRLGREVKLGSLRIKGLSTFRVDQIEVSHPPSFSAGTLLAADSLEVSARLLPLLFRKLAISEIVLIRPQLSFVRSAEGTIAAAAPSRAASAAPEPARAQAADFLISEVRIERGAITFVDQSTAALSGVIDPVDLRLSHVGPTSPVGAKGTARASFRGISADLFMDADYDPLKGTASLSRFEVKAGSAAVTASGKLDNALKTDRSFNGTLTWDSFDPSAFAAVVPLPEGLAVTGPTSGRLEISGAGPKLSSRLNADLTSADVRWKTLAQKAPRVPLAAVVNVDRGVSGDWQVRDLLVKLASMEIRGDGTVRGATETARIAAFRFETNAFDIADLFRSVQARLPTPLSLAGSVRATASIEGWTGGGRFVADIDGAGLDATYGQAFRKAPGTPLRLLADGRYATPLAVDFSSVRLDLESLSLSGGGSYTTGKIRPTYVFRVKTNAFPLTVLKSVVPLTEPYRPVGEAVVRMRISRGPQKPLIAGTATLLNAGCTVRQAVVNDLAGRLDFSGDALTATKLTGRLHGEPLEVSVKGTNLSERPSVDVDLRMAQLDLGRLFPAPQKTEAPRPRFDPLSFAAVAHAAEISAPFVFDTKGTLRAGAVVHPDFSGENLAVDWDLRSVTADLSGLSGSARLRQGAGEARNIKTLIENSAAARIVLGPLNLLQKLDAASGGTLKIPALERLAFRSIFGDYTFEKGIAKLAPMSIDAPALSARVEGTVGLAAPQEIRLRAVITALSSEFEGAVGRALAALGEKQTVRLTMSGTVSAPKVSIDKQALEQKIGDVLRDLLGNGR